VFIQSLDQLLGLGRESAFLHESVVDLVGMFEEAPGLESREPSIDFFKPYIDNCGWG
jgi:hypothetical protein